MNALVAQQRLMAEQNALLALHISRQIAADKNAAENRNYQGWLASVISTGVGVVDRTPQPQPSQEPGPVDDDDAGDADGAVDDDRGAEG